MKRFALVSVALLGLQAAGCDKQEIDNIPFENFDLSSTDDLASTVAPLPPFLGAQIDRMGRPAVNTALTNPFDLTKMGKTTDQVKNEYNVALPQAWIPYGPQPYIATNLAVWDALDGTCGNQGQALSLYSAPASSTSYNKLATILADDRLIVNTALGRCTAFLAVEQNSNMDCGGRTPLMDVIDTLYTFLSGSTAAVTDGVAADPDGMPTPPSLSVFPFLKDPT
jgi:hypothetical protein